LQPPGHAAQPAAQVVELGLFDDTEIVHRYTRADAIRDGVLIDVSAVAREAGIRYPVALTRAAWERCITVPPGVLCQDEAGRLWDVLWLLALAGAAVLLLWRHEAVRLGAARGRVTIPVAGGCRLRVAKATSMPARGHEFRKGLARRKWPTLRRCDQIAMDL
jgi:hypothetical protein